MKRIDILAFTTSLILFGVVAFLPESRLGAQMPYWCPGGSNLLCGTSTKRTCLRTDPATAQCAEWKEETLYYYYPPEGGGGGGGCEGPGGTCPE